PPDMVLPIVEWLALGGICRWIRPQRVFEIGTYTGSSTLTMAMNWPDAARIYTLDLDPSEREALFTQMAVRLPSFAVGEQFQNFAAAGLPQSRVHIVTGRFEDTLPHWKPFPISFLHLDCDWYESVKLCLKTFHDSVLPGGAVVFDDYGF